MDFFTRSIYAMMSFRLRAIERYETKAEEIQKQQLQSILKQARGTAYGEQNGMNKLCSASYSKIVPIINYDSLAPFTERMIEGKRNILFPSPCNRFAVSSGTSAGRSKYLPVNKKHLRACHFKGGSDTVWLYLSTRPDSRLFQTKSLVLGGVHAPTEMNKKICRGDLSSILIEQMPFLGEILRVPSKKTLLQSDWSLKIKNVIAETHQANVGSLAGVPSWILGLLKGILALRGENDFSSIWPNLEVFFHGGISFSPYREEYKKLIPSSRMQYRETYNASEGFFAIQDEPKDDSMLLMLDYGVYYEFLPLSELENPQAEAIPLEGVEVGKVYALIISTLGGLYRYMIGDTIIFTSKSPYKIKIVGRTSSFINSFGEELMVYDADQTLSRTADYFSVRVKDYTVAPLFLNDIGKGRHEWVIECEKEPEDKLAFAAMLQEELCKENSDYDAKSKKGSTLLPLKIYFAPPHTFETYLAKEGKLGGQHKVPRLKNDRSVIDVILQQIGILS